MVFTSGIVDEEPCLVPALLSTARPSWGLGVEPGVLGLGGEVAHCWALRDQTPLGLLGPDTSCGVDGRGGLVVCELDSGREHLPMPLHQEVSDF